MGINGILCNGDLANLLGLVFVSLCTEKMSNVASTVYFNIAASILRYDEADCIFCLFGFFFCGF